MSAGGRNRPVWRRRGRAAALALIAAAAMLAACAEDGSPARSASDARSSAPAPALETAPVVRAPVPRGTRFDGVVEALNEATVAAQTGGRVRALPFDVGDYVPEDEVVVRLTDTEQRARVASAEGALAQARARLTEAQLEFERVQDLFEQELIAKSELDRAAADLASARARVEAGRASLEEAREQLGYTVIRAPYAGTLVERHVQVGETVRPGTLLLTGLSLERLRAVVEIPQQHIGALRAHREVRVLADGQSLPAQELRIPPKADPGTHTFRVLVTLPEGDHGIFPGTLVKVAFVSGEAARLLIPADAVVRRGELTGAYVVTDDGVGFRYLRTGTPTADGRVPVLAGLEPGERVALDAVAAAAAYKRGPAGAAAGGP
ncbi:MAG: efflux RND transporter periplasmic adaptor subunit [Pseudomonadota bacterium]